MQAQLFSLVFCFNLLISPSVLALEYQGKNIDGRRIDARAYYQGTGGVYRVQVEFRGDRATLYFENGGETTIYLRRAQITDTDKIEGVGRLGYWPVNNIFSIGLENQNQKEIGGFGNRADLWVIEPDRESLQRP